MKKMYKSLMFIALLTISVSTFAQEVIKGKITNIESGEPIEGVDVRFIGTQLEVTSAVDGSFTIEKVGTTNTLIFSHPNFDQRRINTRDLTG